MNICRIRYFLALLDTLNFSQTARTLGISQPALTKAIARLETEVGGKLIRREGRHTHLTPLGEVMENQFRDIDQATCEAESVARRQLDGSRSQLRMAIMQGLGPSRMARLLGDFHRHHVNTEIVLYDTPRSELVQSLLDGQVDCALVGAPLHDEPRLRYLILYEEPFVIISAQPCCTGELSDQPMDKRRHQGYAELAEQALHEQPPQTTMLASTRDGKQLRPIVRSELQSWAEALVMEGLGMAVVSGDALLVAGLHRAHVTRPLFQRTVALAVATGHEDTPVIRSFMELARLHPWPTPSESQVPLQ